MKRLEATNRINGVSGRVVRAEGRDLPRVGEVWVFGSYARGALEVGDVDLVVEFEQTLRALDMRATVDHEEFFVFQHGDGRLKLVERLADAHRAGELPRLHARVHRLAQDAGDIPDTCDLLTHRTFRPNCSSCPQDLSPKSSRLLLGMKKRS